MIKCSDAGRQPPERWDCGYAVHAGVTAAINIATTDLSAGK